MQGNSFLIDSRKLKADNQLWNKKVSTKKEGKSSDYWDSWLDRVTRKRNHQMRDGINFHLTEESYTSKSSFLDGDSLPKYGVSEAGRSPKPEGWKASGRRILRGLYLTGEKFLVNADLNGSANILKKVTGKLKLNLSKLTLSVFDHRNEN
jgi:hypothetical protein